MAVIVLKWAISWDYGTFRAARMRRLAWAFAGRLCDKYHNLMSWLKFEQTQCGFTS